MNITIFKHLESYLKGWETEGNFKKVYSLSVFMFKFHYSGFYHCSGFSVKVTKKSHLTQVCSTLKRKKVLQCFFRGENGTD